MKNRILFVDDDPNILEDYKRSLRGRFEIVTAPDGPTGLEALEARGPFEVVVSDYRMPGMNGVQFLTLVRDRSPDTVRIMLTGFADVQTAMDAVNQGHIFRFLAKPCSADQLARILLQGVEHFRLVTAEKELLEKTLKGVIKMLTDLLSLLSPEAFGRASRIRRYAGEVARAMGIREVWKTETAALLSQIGCLLLPDETLAKVSHGMKLTQQELKEFQNHPQIAAQLLANIPRMEEVAEILACLKEASEDLPMPQHLLEESVPLEASILQVVLSFDLLESRGKGKAKALQALKEHPLRYDPAVLAALEKALGDEAKFVARSLGVRELRPSMIFSEDVMNAQGQILISRGQEASPVLLERLRKYAEVARIREPIRVFVPVELTH